MKKVCSACGGKGKKLKPMSAGLVRGMLVVTCSKCKGTGDEK